MLIEFENIKKYGIVPHGVIHVGMHKAEEYPIYKKAGVGTIMFIEANERLAHEFAPDDADCYTVHAAVSDKCEWIEFNITNNGESSSILELGDHSLIYPHIVNVETVRMKTTTLDIVLEKVIGPYFALNFNILNLDIQGAELKAMMGLTWIWEYIDAVFTEVNYREMYKGCALVSEIDEFLETKGLKKVEEVDTGCGWGDALYVKR
jgi:FkbM family methyltransferase